MADARVHTALEAADPDSARNSFAWPSAATLVARAETALGVAPRQLGLADAVTSPTARASIGDLELHLVRLESFYHALVPPGFESGGRLAVLKRFLKKATRRLMWWYVEPRWDVQRQATAELAGFVQATIEMMRSMSEDLRDLRARVD